jgi:hypothetical protein
MIHKPYDLTTLSVEHLNALRVKRPDLTRMIDAELVRRGGTI